MRGKRNIGGPSLVLQMHVHQPHADRIAGAVVSSIQHAVLRLDRRADTLDGNGPGTIQPTRRSPEGRVNSWLRSVADELLLGIRSAAAARLLLALKPVGADVLDFPLTARWTQVGVGHVIPLGVARSRSASRIFGSEALR